MAAKLATNWMEACSLNPLDYLHFTRSLVQLKHGESAGRAMAADA